MVKDNLSSVFEWSGHNPTTMNHLKLEPIWNSSSNCICSLVKLSRLMKSVTKLVTGCLRTKKVAIFALCDKIGTVGI